MIAAAILLYELILYIAIKTCLSFLLYSSIIFSKAMFSIFFSNGRSCDTAGKQVKSNNAKSNDIRLANAVPVPVSP